MTDPSAQAVLDAIHHVLQEQGISRRQLALKIGWGRMRTQHLLSGNTKLTVADLQAIAAALGVPITQFLPQAEPAPGGAR